MGLERGPLSLVSTTEELLERKSSGSGLESQDYGHRGSVALITRHLHNRKKLVLTSPSGGLSVGRVRLWTQATEFVYELDIHAPNVLMSCSLLRAIS
jgi:hypothetical protein